MYKAREKGEGAKQRERGQKEVESEGKRGEKRA
jgi:hypothetical protein